MKEIALDDTDMLIWNIVEVYGEEGCPVEGRPDVVKMDTPILCMPDGPFPRVGKRIADAPVIKVLPRSP